MLGYSFRALKEVFRLKIKGVIQIGAHTGQEILALNGEGVKNLLLIEPLKKPFAKLNAYTILHKRKFNSLLLERELWATKWVR